MERDIDWFSSPAASEYCGHEQKKYEMSDGKIRRYKEVCASCGKYSRWVPNQEALDMGLAPDESWDIIKGKSYGA